MVASSFFIAHSVAGDEAGSLGQSLVPNLIRDQFAFFPEEVAAPDPPAGTFTGSGIFWPVTHNTASSQPPETPPAPTPKPSMLIGCNWHAAWAEQSNDTTRGAILDKLVSWGCQAVRLDFAWATLEPTKGTYSWTALDKYVNDAFTRDLSVLLMLYWPPQWSSGSTSKTGVPGSYADYGNILGKVAQRYGTKLIGIEMWNEPDISTFWAGTRPQFAAMLAAAYPVAKAMSPGTTFIAGAPTYVGLANGWIADMYQNASYKAGVSYDAQAIHPYMSPIDLPPGSPKTNWSIRGIEDLQALRSSKGDTSPLWATEFGWSTHTNTGTEPNWMRGVTDAQQAAYTTDAFTMLNNYGVKASFVYTEKDMSQTSEPHERNFGLTRVDYSEKPVVPALRAMYADVAPGPPSAVVIGGSSALSQAAAATSMTMTLPTGLQNGDQLFIAAVCSDTASGCAITETKTGWTTTTAKADQGTMQRVLYTTTYSALTTVPSWALSSSRRCAYVCVAIRNGAVMQEAHAEAGGLTSTAPALTSTSVGLGLRLFVRKDNLSTSVTPDAGMVPITGALAIAPGPACHVQAYTTDQATAGAMAAAATTWPVTSVNSTAWTIAV